MTLTITADNPPDEANTYMREERKRHENELDKENIRRQKQRPR